MANPQLDTLITELGTLGQNGATLLQSATTAKTQQTQLIDSIKQLMNLVQNLNSTNVNIDEILKKAQAAKAQQVTKLNDIQKSLDGNPDANAIQQVLKQASDLIAQHQRPGAGQGGPGAGQGGPGAGQGGPGAGQRGPGGQPGARPVQRPPGQPHRDAAGAGLENRPPFRTGGYTYGASRKRRKNRRKRTKKSRKKGSYKKNKKYN